MLVLLNDRDLTIPVRSCRSPERVQRPTPSRFPQYAPRSQRRSVSELAGGDCGLNKSRALRLSFGRSQVHVTIPSWLPAMIVACPRPQRLPESRRGARFETSPVLAHRGICCNCTKVVGVGREADIDENS